MVLGIYTQHHPLKWKIRGLSIAKFALEKIVMLLVYIPVTLQMASKIQRSRSHITKFFDRRALMGQRVYTLMDLTKILEEQRIAWNLRKVFYRKEFIEFLESHCSLKCVVFESEVLGSRTRYVWGEASQLEQALSLFSGCYLSHATAVFMHQLTEQIPRRIFINHEQSAKPAPSTKLSQEDITRAFKSEARKTRGIFTVGDQEIVALTGKQTGNFEVGEVESPAGQFLRCTKLERTLIDITVRPHYGGGIYQVLKAYETAKDRVAVTVLIATLKTLDFAYPYHQAIGFLMERAGYEEARTRRLLAFGLDFDFYLLHGMGDKVHYSEKWRLFYPAGF